MRGSAIVTGSDRGIGRAIAVALSEAGFDLGITWYATEAGGRATAEEVREQGRRAELRRLDLREPPAAASVIHELVDTLGGLALLVNNAGGSQTAPFLELGWEDWRAALALNLDGAFLCAQAAARRMAAAGNGGRIVNVTSIHEQVPSRGGAAYCAAKGGLGMLTRVMALELAEHAITVNAVAPGEIATAMTGHDDVDPATVQRPGIPVGRPGHAAEVAAAVVFLAGDGAAYVTGQSIVVDGGLTLMSAVQNR